VAAKKCPIYPEKKMFESGRGESVQSGKGGEKGDPSGGDLFRRKTGPVLAPFAPLSFFRSADMKSGGGEGWLQLVCSRPADLPVLVGSFALPLPRLPH